MKGARGYMDLGSIFDEIFEAAQDFKDEIHRNFQQYGGGIDPEGCGRGGRFGPGGVFGKNFFDENTDFYPNYSYPPMNVYMTADRSMVFEFALAGFDEKDISLSFQGDYMVFSARMAEKTGEEGTGEEPANPRPEDNVRYFKRRLKMKDIEKQKYYVPLDKYAQDQVKAVYKNGILKVRVPPKDEPDQNDGIKIEIVKEGV
ncbi:MAG: Hsp20/alpha crystallin family protein [Treponema sp.]|jgi:HSP20 family molecular chaperone IbpA|nr:Hsp20/alpha crystallin family protein [Treponema sp.]